MSFELRSAAMVALATVAVATGCEEKRPPLPAQPPTSEQTQAVATPGQDGWPTLLFYGRLGVSEAELRRQARDGNAAGFNPSSAEFVRAHYDQIGPTAHGAAGGTDVFWSKQRDLFFIRSECEGHHAEGWLGPFSGDPRERLKPPMEPSPKSQKQASGRSLREKPAKER